MLFVKVGVTIYVKVVGLVLVDVNVSDNKAFAKLPAPFIPLGNIRLQIKLLVPPGVLLDAVTFVTVPEHIV